MADNRIAYGIAKGLGLDTKGKSPEEVWKMIDEGQSFSLGDTYDMSDAQFRSSLKAGIQKSLGQEIKAMKMNWEEESCVVRTSGGVKLKYDYATQGGETLVTLAPPNEQFKIQDKGGVYY